MPQTMPTESRRQRALSRPETHSFGPGIGYIDHGGPPTDEPGDYPADLCEAPEDAYEGSLHFLKTPGGALMVFKWTRRGVWICPEGLQVKAHRLGFEHSYLSRAGWQYSGPV